MAASPPRERIRCPACGRPFLVTTQEFQSRPVCPQCGCFADRPPAQVADVNRHRIVEGTTDDDGQPYGVFGEKPVPPCPSCEKPLPEDAAVCAHCNWHREAGKVLPRTFIPFNKTWEAGWSFRHRFLAFLVFQLLNAVSAVVVVWKTGALPTTVVGWIAVSVVQAFVLGTYDRLTLARTAKGKVTLTKVWRACFWPLPPRAIRWREHEGIIVRHSTAGLLEWLMLLILLPGIVLPILWWWYAIRPNHVTVALTQNLGEPVSILYAGTNEPRAKEIAGAVRDLTELPCDRLD
jgi:hypothetical protein